MRQKRTWYLVGYEVLKRSGGDILASATTSIYMETHARLTASLIKRLPKRILDSHGYTEDYAHVKITYIHKI